MTGSFKSKLLSYTGNLSMNSPANQRKVEKSLMIDHQTSYDTVTIYMYRNALTSPRGMKHQTSQLHLIHRSFSDVPGRRPYERMESNRGRDVAYFP